MNKIIDFFKPRTIEWTGEEPEQPMRDWCMFLNLSALSGFIIPFGNLIGPLIMWIMKKDESKFVDAHGRATIDFHISLFIIGIVGGTIGILTTVICIGFVILLVVGLGLLVAWILGLIQSIQAAKAGKLYRYPASFAFLSGKPVSDVAANPVPPAPPAEAPPTDEDEHRQG